MPDMELWTIYADAGGLKGGPERATSLEAETPESLDLGGLTDDVKRFGDQWPRVYARSITDLRLKQETDGKPRGSYDVKNATGRILALPFGGTVAVIQVVFKAKDALGAAQLMRDMSFRKMEVKIGSVALSDWVTANHPGSYRPDFEPGRVHQLVTIPAGIIFRRCGLKRLSPSGPPRTVDFDTVGQLVHKEPGRYRAEVSQSRLWLPPEGNYFSHHFLAVTSHTTIAVGHERSVILAIMLSASLALGSTVQAMSIRQAAIGAASNFGQRETRAIDLEALGALAYEIRRLELATSHVVSAYSDPAFVTGDERVAGYRRAIGEALDLARGATVLRALLQNMSEAVQTTLSEHQAAARAEDDRRRDAQENRVRRLTWLASSVAFFTFPVTLTTGFFGMNTPEVNENVAIFSSDYATWWILLAAITILTIVASVWGPKLSGERPRPTARERDQRDTPMRWQGVKEDATT